MIPPPLMKFYFIIFFSYCIRYIKKKHLNKIKSVYIKLQMFIEHHPFQIVSATYYSHEKDATKIGNVTPVIQGLFHQYLSSAMPGATPYIVSNNLFTDTQYGVPKNLFINVQDDVTKRLYKYIFAEGSHLDLRFIFENLKSHIPTPTVVTSPDTVRVSVSIGEIVDKHSILDIKLNRMTNPDKITDIRREMEELAPTVARIEKNNHHLYRMLVYVNTLIWEDTDAVKELLRNYDATDFIQVSRNATLSNSIFANNQKRFRIKRLLNDLYSSEVKEHKSYAEESCFVRIGSMEDIYRKIPEMNFLSITYDVLYVIEEYTKVIEQLFPKHCFVFLAAAGDEVTQWFGETYDLSTDSVWESGDAVRKVFDLEPICYVSGGKLGDFCNQLSVICENYYKTGRKGILYISGTLGDPFVFGVESTYHDTYPIVSEEEYILEYKIHQGEPTDVDLSSWRNGLILRNWCEMFHLKYGVDWGTHQWITPPNLDLPVDFSNKILINTTPYRFPTATAIQQLKETIGSELSNCVFLSNEEEHYRNFMQQTGLRMAHYKPSSFSELVKIIHVSRACYFGLSSSAVLANTLHKPHTLLGTDCEFDCVLNQMKGILPHVLGMLR